jgi:hypothetical protein
MHYWHAHFMADSVRSAIDELESDLITNQVHHLDFVKMLDRLSELAERDGTILRGGGLMHVNGLTRQKR